MNIEAIWNHTYGEDCIPNFSDNMALPRHRWYEFKEGYGASLVERAILETKQATQKSRLLVLDPFSGEDVIIVTRGKNAVFNRVLKLPQSYKTTNWCAA